MYQTLRRWNPTDIKMRLNFLKAFVRAQTNIAVEIEELEKASPPEEIPGPVSLPFIGTLYKYLPGGEYVYDRAIPTGVAMMRKYGKIVREEQMPGLNIVHVFDPDMAQKVARNEGKQPIRPLVLSMVDYRVKKNIPVGIGNSNGHDWYRLRSLLNRQMMRPDNVEFFLPTQEEVAEDLIRSMKKIRNEKGEIENFGKQLYMWSCESIGVVCYETRLGVIRGADDNKDNKKQQQFVEAAHRIFENLQKSMMTDFIFKKMGMKNKYEEQLFKDFDDSWSLADEFVKAASEKTKKAGGSTEEEKSLLHRLLEIPDISEDEVHVMIHDLFFAAIDSTGSSMGFLLYNLARNPDKQELLRQEVHGVAPPGTKVTAESLRNMPFLKACARESQRVSPTAAFGPMRILNKDIILGGYRIPAGWLIISHNDVMSQSPDIFPQPDSFLPERWMRGSKSGLAHHPFASLPFGYGARMCIGRRFAEQEIHLLTAKIMQNFKMEYKYGDISAIWRTFNRPDKPLRISFKDL